MRWTKGIIFIAIIIVIVGVLSFSVGKNYWENTSVKTVVQEINTIQSNKEEIQEKISTPVLSFEQDSKPIFGAYGNKVLEGVLNSDEIKKPNFHLSYNNDAFMDSNEKSRKLFIENKNKDGAIYTFQYYDFWKIPQMYLNRFDYKSVHDHFVTKFEGNGLNNLFWGKNILKKNYLSLKQGNQSIFDVCSDLMISEWYIYAKCGNVELNNPKGITIEKLVEFLNSSL